MKIFQKKWSGIVIETQPIVPTKPIESCGGCGCGGCSCCCYSYDFCGV